jgi:hypothetical protein
MWESLTRRARERLRFPIGARMVEVVSEDRPSDLSETCIHISDNARPYSERHGVLAGEIASGEPRGIMPRSAASCEFRPEHPAKSEMQLEVLSQKRVASSDFDRIIRIREALPTRLIA